MKSKIETLSLHLRAAHRRFLENERRQAEGYFGRAIPPYEFLKLLMEDKNFAWLRPFSALIADIDAFADEAENISQEDLNRIREQVNSVLRNAESSSLLYNRYQAHLNEDPDFVMLHADVTKALNDLSPKH